MEQDQMLTNEIRGFDDERINYESGRIYQWGILWAVLYTVVFALSRLLFLGNTEGVSLSLFISEIAVIASGTIILFIGLIRWGFGRDERRVAEKHRYYLTAGKVFLITAVAGYALSIPLRSHSGLNDYATNELLMQLEVLGCVYFFFAFKRRMISFNYTFIHETGWGYYGHVLRNIGRLALYALIPFGVASALDFFSHMSAVYFFAIGTAYALTAFDLGLCYFLLSLTEKLNYDAETSRRLKNGTLIASIIALAKLGEVVICRLLAAAVVAWYPMSQPVGDVTYGEALAAMQTAANDALSPALVATALALCLLMEQEGCDKRVRRGVGGILAVQATDFALNTLQTAVVVFLERISDDPTTVRRVTDVLSVWSALVWLATLGFVCLLVYGLVRRSGVSRALWIPVGAVAVCQTVAIFFGTQSMCVARALAAEGGAWVAMAAGVVIVAKSLRKVERQAD